ncbi:MAG: hypothetical protein E5299_00965 [Burkholderia gladioli]|nr:MAG: hypothetical protein E5299_00965 [Burkholderia gladioli]
MYRFKILTGHCLWARNLDSQATEVSIRVGASSTVWRTSLVRNPFVSPEIMPVVIASPARFMQQRLKNTHAPDHPRYGNHRSEHTHW